MAALLADANDGANMTSALLNDEAKKTGGSKRQKSAGHQGKALQTWLLPVAPVVSGVTAELQTTAAIRNPF